jgi:hypothetical protein
MGETWKDDIHGVIVEHDGSLAHIPADGWEIDMVCPECGEDTLSGNCSCWEWEYQE